MRSLSTSFRVAAVAGALCCAALIGPSTVSSVSAGAVSDVGTPLPPGWELCILQGLTAPATAANVANLDEWQAVEGGSTANTAAFNPFNTRRTTDLHGTPLPNRVSANGFPAFVNWLAGCAATVATLEQQNMWAIDVALKAGGVSPPGEFLATVDQTQWCAPSGGQPCYLAEITGSSGGAGLGTDGIPAVLVRSSALGVYGDVRSELGNFELALAVVASDQSAQSGLRQALVSSDAAVSSAQSDAARVEKKLGTFALAEYVSGNLFEGSAFLGGTEASTQSQLSEAATQYTNLTAAQLVTTEHNALAAVARTQAERDSVAHQLAQATSTLSSDTAAESRTLITLLAAESTLQTAGACTAVPTVATPANNPDVPSASSPGQAATTTSDTSSSTTTTTTTQPSGSRDGVSRGDATTSTTSSTTTTSSQPATSPSTTTTTTPPPVSPTPTQTETANSAGILSLQGCVATFMPGAGA